MADTFDAGTLAFYAREAATYVDRPVTLHPALARFLKLLPEGAHILELGCGGGRDAKHMIDAGFDVDATDGVAEMAAQAEAWLGQPVRVMRFDELEAVARYDAVIANASLLHVPLVALPLIIARIWRALKPGGWHFASYKTGTPQGRDRFGRYYNQIARGEAEALYDVADAWEDVRWEESHEPGYFGEASDWLAVVARKRIGA